jgi:hypothetical protein
VDAPQCDVGRSAPPYYVLAWGESAQKMHERKGLVANGEPVA